MLSRSAIVAVALSFAAALHAVPVSAQGLTRGSRPDVSVRLVVGGADQADPSLRWLGVDVRLGAGWHTYWRSPGDAGAAPEFDWSGSQNIASADVKWPAPRRMTFAGIDTFGYTDEVVFPVEVRRRDPDIPTRVALKLALYVCSELCTREDVQLDATIAPGGATGDGADLVNAWRSKVPRRKSPDLSITSLTLSTAPSARLRIEGNSAAPPRSLDAFVDGDDAVTAGRPVFAMTGAHGFVATLPLDGTGAAGPRKPLRVTLVDGEHSVEAIMPVPAASAGETGLSGADGAGRGIASAWSMIAVALLGGIVLNFMPCVFPVLSLKLFSLSGHGFADSRALRAGLLASAFGIIASFLVIAATLAALKLAGAQVGWGIQFQQPLFLAGMAAILVAFAANLLGLYELTMPAWLGGWFGGAAGGSSVAAQFFNGFVMTLLATPCSAPFVGTAVGFALSQGPWQILEIFAPLGLGMALPYLALATLPGLARIVPKPGRWMLAVRPLAALALLGTAVWLLTILAAVSGVRVALVAGTSLGMLMWGTAVFRRRLAHLIAGALMAGLAGLAIVGPGRQAPSAEATAAPAVPWQPLVTQDIPALVRSGRTVFVDIGAAWCVTCKVNEALIVHSEAIQRRLASDVVPLQADWTRPDDAISAYLHSFGRYGLPFNAVFGPGAPDGIVLPELLTQAAVLAALNRAAAHTSSN